VFVLAKPLFLLMKTTLFLKPLRNLFSPTIGAALQTGAGLSGARNVCKKMDGVKDAIEKMKNKSPDDYTPEQLEALEEVMDAWNSIKGFLTVMRYAGATLKWCVAFALAFAAFKSGLFGAFAK
jgi:hypothetical protein